MNYYTFKKWVMPQGAVGHSWELPVIHYHKILVTFPSHFLVVITRLFSWIILINDCKCILTGSPG